MGLLSQAVANLIAAEQQITGLGGLPPGAQTIQTNSSVLIGSIVSQIRQIQGLVGGFVSNATSSLNAIETMIANNAPPPQIKAAIMTVQIAAATLKSQVATVSGPIVSALAQVDAFAVQLNSVESGLAGQISGLQGQLGDAQGEEEAAQKRYYWLIALGPFGLVGLAVALGLYLHWKSQVNDLESQISSLNSQIGSLNAMVNACRQMGGDFQDVVTKISGVRNTVNFLFDDVLAIITDLNLGDNMAIVEIAVKAAITEATALGIDAS